MGESLDNYRNAISKQMQKERAAEEDNPLGV